jgi:hypothetical protein
MAVTILSPHPETYTTYVLPKRAGYEDRDLRAYPLPPNTTPALVNAVVDELRSQGHTVSVAWKRERLVDWGKTRKMDQHDRELYEGDGTLLHFVGGGWWAQAVCDGRVTTLEAQHLRMSRAMLRLVIAGHP